MIIIVALYVIRGLIIIPYYQKLSTFQLKIITNELEKNNSDQIKKSEKRLQRQRLNEKINIKNRNLMNKKTFCPYCGNKIEQNTIICTLCGENIHESKSLVIYCQQCGNKNELNQKICQRCGDTLNDEKELRIINKESFLEDKK